MTQTWEGPGLDCALQGAWADHEGRRDDPFVILEEMLGIATAQINSLLMGGGLVHQHALLSGAPCLL